MLSLIIELSENSTLIIDSISYTLAAPVDDVNTTIDIIQYPASVGEPVKWVKNVSRDTEGEIIVDMPSSAYNISAHKSDKRSGRSVTLDTEMTSKNKLSEKQLYEARDILEKVSDDEALLRIKSPSTNVEIEYLTEAPVSSESLVKKNIKRVLVSSDTHYTDVVVKICTSIRGQ